MTLLLSKNTKEVNNILSLLKSPEQDYQTLADKASRFPHTESSLESVLAIYFKFFATGYVY